MDSLQMHVGALPTSKVLYQTLKAVKNGQRLARAFHVSNALHLHLGAVKNGQDFQHWWMGVGKEVRTRGTRNIGILTKKPMEID